MCDCEIGQVQTRVDCLEEEFKEMADVMLGTPKTRLEGGGRNEDGMRHKVDKIEEQMSNGGLKVRMSVAQYTFAGTVSAALISLLTALVVSG